MIQGHGGNIYAMARQLGCNADDIIDMSSNINPLGMPPGLREYLKDHLDMVGVLPEADACAAVGHMAGLLDVDAHRILAGQGTTQFIYTTCPALEAQNVLIVGPTYADYADACRMHDIQPHYFLAQADHHFQVDLEGLAQALPGIDTVFICNPNNPTGGLIDHDGLHRLCEEHPGTHFIIDESYLPFVPAGQSQSMSTCELDNVSVLWSISKIFGLPGIRAGFLIAAEPTIARFQRFMQPWALNSLAQAAVAYLGRHPAMVAEFIEETRRFLEQERRCFQEALAAATPLTVFASLTSYFLMALPDGRRAGDVCGGLAQKRVLIRDCSNFYGLSERFVRLALKGPAVNRAAVDHLAAILG